MWWFHPQKLCILAGLCIFIVVHLTDHAESHFVAGKTRGKSRGPFKMRPRPNTKKRKPVKKPPKKFGKQKPGMDKKKNPPAKNNVNVYQCPDEAVQMNCLSCRTKVYRKCPVMAASKITEVRILNEYETSKDSCLVGRKKNFGIIDNSIWVNYGCRAKFLICYEKEKREQKTIDCSCTKSKRTCPIGYLTINIHVQVTMLWSYGAGRCKQGQTWGYDDRNIWVKDGCSATFRAVS